jgi:hypothetical protein
MKTLKQLREIYAPNTKDEKKFIDKHKVQKTPDANKNKDDVFTGSNVKSAERQPKHGYSPGQDEKVYEDYVNDRQRKAVWASRNDEKEKRMRKKIREELDLIEMDDAAGGYPVAGNLKKPAAQTPVNPKKYEKKKFDDAAGGYPVVKGTTKEEAEIEEASAYKKRGMKSDDFPSRLDPLEVRQTMKGSVKTISKTDPEISKKFTTKKLMKMFPLKNEEVELHEARKLIKAYTSGAHGAKVYKNPETGEHEVDFFKHGKNLGEGPRYHTNDADDAHATAKSHINKMSTQKEQVELDEVSAPGKEDWIKANKQRFVKEYGKEKGLRILYAKAWKMANKDG